MLNIFHRCAGREQRDVSKSVNWIEEKKFWLSVRRCLKRAQVGVVFKRVGCVFICKCMGKLGSVQQNLRGVVHPDQDQPGSYSVLRRSHIHEGKRCAYV